jgi:hypothetical protein
MNETMKNRINFKLNYSKINFALLKASPTLLVVPIVQILQLSFLGIFPVTREGIWDVDEGDEEDGDAEVPSKATHGENGVTQKAGTDSGLEMRWMR